VEAAEMRKSLLISTSSLLGKTWGKGSAFYVVSIMTAATVPSWRGTVPGGTSIWGTLQGWAVSDQVDKGVDIRHLQRTFQFEGAKNVNTWQAIVTPDGRAGSENINKQNQLLSVFFLNLS
jgi:hypothetical protein